MKREEAYRACQGEVHYHPKIRFFRFYVRESQRPAPAGHATCARGSHDLRPRVTRPAPAGRWQSAEENRESRLENRESLMKNWESLMKNWESLMKNWESLMKSNYVTTQVVPECESMYRA